MPARKLAKSASQNSMSRSRGSRSGNPSARRRGGRGSRAMTGGRAADRIWIAFRRHPVPTLGAMALGVGALLLLRKAGA